MRICRKLGQWMHRLTAVYGGMIFLFVFVYFTDYMHSGGFSFGGAALRLLVVTVVMTAFWLLVFALVLRFHGLGFLHRLEAFLPAALSAGLLMDLLVEVTVSGASAGGAVLLIMAMLLLSVMCQMCAGQSKWMLFHRKQV